MDAVKHRIEQLGGRLELLNTPGGGLRTCLQVPVAVTLSRCVLLPVGERTFAVPAAAVESALREGPGDILPSPSGPVYVGGGERLSVASLPELLGEPGPHTASHCSW
jgi:two-component system chemotaxis sensor kinase CheA